GLHEAEHRLALREVAREGLEVAARGTYRGLDGTAARLLLGAYADDVGARFGESNRHREADATSRAGDERGAAAQVEEVAHDASLTSTRSFMARPASRSANASWVCDSGTMRVMSRSAGMSPSRSSSTAVSKSWRWYTR